MGARAVQYFEPGVTGELAVGLSEVNPTSQKCRMVMFKAHPSNSGIVSIGFATGVTAAAKTTTTTAGYPLAAGQDSPWFLCSNLNEFFLIADGAGQGCSYVTAQ